MIRLFKDYLRRRRLRAISLADRRDAWREEMWGHYRLSRSYWERKNILYFIRKYG